MRFKSAAEVMAVARDRGFQIKVDPGPPPMPYLLGQKDHATPVLLMALKAWRLEIIKELLSKEQP